MTTQACPHAELARLQAESEGRRVELLRLADAHRAEWARAERAEADNAVLVEALDATATPEAEDPCRYDHHGYCQSHSLSHRPCYMARSRAILAAFHPGAPLLRLVEAVRAWKTALDTTDGIAVAEQAVLAALEEV
jgi:hypothetical protein